jgi:hypothetical protein
MFQSKLEINQTKKRRNRIQLLLHLLGYKEKKQFSNKKINPTCFSN